MMMERRIMQSADEEEPTIVGAEGEVQWNQSAQRKAKNLQSGTFKAERTLYLQVVSTMSS
jgi:hypothetical protein